MALRLDLCQAQRKAQRQECLCYSERRAARASIAEARRAGRYPAKEATAKSKTETMTMVGRSLDVRPKSMVEIRRQAVVAHEIPMARPMNESTRVSGRTIQRTFRRCAPAAPFNRWPVRDVRPG